MRHRLTYSFRSLYYFVSKGICEFENNRISFDIVHLSQTHPSCKYLSGLLDMFKEMSPYEYKDPVMVSVRFTYELKKFANAAFVSKRKFAFAADSLDESATNNSEIRPNTILPLGAALDPVLELLLYCTWPEMAENVVIDSRTYTDLDPLLASTWSFRMHYEAIPICFMSECLFEMIQQCDSTKTLADLLGSEYTFTACSEWEIQEDPNPLERLTESKISKLTSSVFSAALPVTNAASSKKSGQNKLKPLEGPLKNEQLMAMLYYLFPDAEEESKNLYNIPTSDAVSFFTCYEILKYW